MPSPTPQQLERVLIDALDREPDSELIESPDWVQVRTPSSPFLNHNLVGLARLPEHEVDPRIRAVLDEHAKRGASFRWVVGPSSRPENLAQRLEAAGLTPLGHTLALTLAVPDARKTPPLDPTGLSPRRSRGGHEPRGLSQIAEGESKLVLADPLSMQQVGPETLDDYIELTTRAWQAPPSVAEALRAIMPKTLHGARNTYSWIARLEGTPVATAHMRILGSIGYFQGCAVLPTYRRRGIYRALLRHRLAELGARGVPLALVWARASTSANTCLALGFQQVTSAEFFQWSPH